MHTTPSYRPLITHVVRRRHLALLAVLLLALAACGSDDDTAAEPSATEAPATEAPATESEGGSGTETDTAGGAVVAITARDYTYEGVPAEIAAGTELTLQGAPEAEPHELVAFRLPDDETRPGSEILAAATPDAPPPGEFAGVLIAPPGGAPGFAPEGPVVLEQPGRYLLVCFIPTGTTAEAFAALAQSGGTAEDLPQSGPPHFVQGMLAEVTVTS